MFFPEKIHLEASDRILEVGPGASPHPRSQILLEKRFPEPEAFRQRAGLPAIAYKRPVIYYEGGTFPFQDREFDYVICSHVLEHVENVGQFAGELCRVGSRGYLEYPTIHYEYLYNFKEHTNLIWFNGEELLWLPKVETSLAEFDPAQQFFRTSLEKGYDDVIRALRERFFQGFEWNHSISVRRARRIDELVPPFSEIQARPKSVGGLSGKDLVNELFRRFGRRLKGFRLFSVILL